ncbi:hypothetical protein O181_007053 [Austropuccinia psidii MF-1]|uniref:Uncharacterized protein n=1 Tax=Austropuccinia psidii MF-1 TaxID=1389203 RepID=A0A9Q3BLM8_9BASI|nr:hypothetical protein [Austropuccinia psidii MF-1]
MGFKCQKQSPQNPLQQDTPIPHMPCKQTPWQLTPGPSGTCWLVDLFPEPPQYNEPPIPAPSPSSKPHEDLSDCEPEPKVAPRHLLEETFGYSSHYSCLVIITDHTPVGSSPIPNPSPPVPSFSTPTLENPPISPKDPTAPSPHSHNEAGQEFTDLNDSSSNHPQLNPRNLVGAFPIDPHDSLHGCASSK